MLACYTYVIEYIVRKRVRRSGICSGMGSDEYHDNTDKPQVIPKEQVYAELPICAASARKGRCCS